MTQAEVGSYIRLLAWQWTKGSIPNDITKVERIAGGPVSEDVIEKFVISEDGFRRNSRLETFRKERLEYMESQKRKSKLGVEARRRKLLPPHGEPAGQPVGQPRVALGLNPSDNLGVSDEKLEVDGLTVVNNIQPVVAEEFSFDELPQNDPKTGNPVVNQRVNPRSTLTSTSTLLGSNSILGGQSRVSLRDEATKILAYLNEKAGRNFRPSDAHITSITARLKEKDVTTEGVLKMIDRQIAKWTGTPYYEYLRPATLFAPMKFGTYYDMRDQPLPSTTSIIQNHATTSQNQTGGASIGDLKRVAAILQDQINTHPANREFVGSAESPTPEQKADLKDRREKLRNIQAQIANQITT